MAQSIYTIAQVICAVFTYLSLIRLLSYDRLSKEYKILIVSLCFIFMYNVTTAFDAYVRSKEAALIAFKLRTLCMGQVLLFMFKFIRKYCKVTIPKWIPALYWGLNAVIVTGVFTAQRGTFFFKNMYFMTQGDRRYLVTVPGPLYYLFMFFCLSIGVWMFGCIVYSYVKKLKKWGKGDVYILLAVLIPLFFGALYYGGALWDYNPSGITLFIAVELLIISADKYKMFDVLEGTRERIINTMDQALIIVDANKCFLDANQQAKRMYPALAKLEKGEKIKMPVGVYIDEHFSEFEFQQDGRYYEGRITPVYNEDGLQGYSACIFDITEKQQYIEQVLAAKNEADRANKAKTRFLSNISHELRTPLNAIIGISEIELRKKLEEQTRFNVQSIYYSGQNLLSLVNNLLDISKIEAEKLVLEKAEYNLDSVLYEVANTIVTSLQESNIRFKVLIEETVPKQLIGDAVRVRAIIMNLLGNAIKYTKKGHIYLKVFWRTDEEESQGYLNIMVEDTGIGIKPENIDSIFKEYEQINSEETKGITGTGLGLSITKQLVELMEGEIHVKSTYGKGSTFEVMIKQGVRNLDTIGKLTITRKNITGILEKDRLEKEQIEDFDGKTVLVVDDMEVNRTVLKGILEPYQLRIETASSGKEAVELVQEKEIDLILMDQMMPELDGFETMQQIRKLSGEKYQQIPAILVTANTMIEQEQDLKQYGFQDYLTKPVNVRRLIRVLKKWLQEDEFPEERETDEAWESLLEDFEKDDLGDKREPETLLLIDRVEGLSHVGGRLELYEEVLKSYYQDGIKTLQKLEQEETLSVSEKRVLVHGIKGSSYNIGAKALGEEAERIEHALKKEDLEYVDANLSSMLTHLKEVLACCAPDETGLDSQKEKRETDEEFVHSLNMLRNEFENYSMGVIEKTLEKLETYNYGEEANEKIQQLKACIQELEYEAGVEILNQWIEKLQESLEK